MPSMKSILSISLRKSAGAGGRHSYNFFDPAIAGRFTRLGRASALFFKGQADGGVPGVPRSGVGVAAGVSVFGLLFLPQDGS